MHRIAIGFLILLLAGLPLARGQDQTAQWTRREAFLLDKLTRALTAGNREIAVEAAEAEAVRDGDIPPLPDAFEVMATVVAGRDREADRVVLHSASGPSGTRVKPASENSAHMLGVPRTKSRLTCGHSPACRKGSR